MISTHTHTYILHCLCSNSRPSKLCNSISDCVCVCLSGEWGVYDQSSCSNLLSNIFAGKHARVIQYNSSANIGSTKICAPVFSHYFPFQIIINNEHLQARAYSIIILAVKVDTCNVCLCVWFLTGHIDSPIESSRGIVSTMLLRMLSARDERRPMPHVSHMEIYLSRQDYV